MIPEGFQPCVVENVESVWIEDNGTHKVILSFDTSDEMIRMGDWSTAPLAADITKIVISRSYNSLMDYEVIATIDNPEGKHIEFIDENLELGTYYYLIKSYAGDVSDWGQNHRVVVGQIAADIEWDQFTAEVDPKKENSIILSLTIPTLSTIGEELRMPITMVQMGEMNPTTYEPMPFYIEEEEEMLEPGIKIQFILDQVSDGAHTYTAQIFTKAGSGKIATYYIYVGKDQPGRVRDIKVNKTDDGILVSWNAPEEGLNGGNMGDVSEITYTVRRGANDADANAVVVAENISELQVLDTVQFEEEKKFVYIITANNSRGEGYPTMSEEILHGPSSSLPYKEGFDVVYGLYRNINFEHTNWTKTFSYYYCSWQLGQNAYVYDDYVSPFNGRGLIYAFYNNWGETHQWDAITTGHIDFSETINPLLTFNLFDLNHGGSDVCLVIEAGNEETGFVELEKITMGMAEQNGWREVSVDLSSLKGNPKGQIRFKSVADGIDCFTVAIDNISIVDYVEQDIESVEKDSSTVKIYNLEGQLVDQPRHGFYIVDGKRVFIK